MSGIGSLGLDSTLRYFMLGGQSVVTGYWCPPRVISCINDPVLHQEASLQKICAHEKTQAASKLSISSCIPTASALYCCTTTTVVWSVRTANNAAI